MTSGQQDEAFFRERGFGLKIGFGARPALIVIDMIKAFTDPAMMLGSNLDQQKRRSRCWPRRTSGRSRPSSRP